MGEDVTKKETSKGTDKSVTTTTTKQSTTTPTTTKKTADGKFSWKQNKDGKVAIVMLSKKKSLHVNWGRTEIPATNKITNKVIPVATQEELKTVYDSNQVWKKFINAPAGHKAPWEKENK